MMDKLEKKTFTTTRQYTYTYYVYKTASTTKPAVVFCHGWPDNAHLWADIVPALLDSGHPLVVPDLLGYDGTSKPTDPQAYNSRDMSTDLYQIIDSEGLDKIIPAGHDWGSFMAQRLYLWRPDRCCGLILLNVAYRPVSYDTRFDLETALQLTEKYFGAPLFAYWEVFAADDGPQLLLDNVENLFHILHWDDPSAMAKAFCVRGAMRRLLQDSSSKSLPLKAYAEKPGFKSSFLERMRRDGFAAPQCWYKAMARNVQFETEQDVPRQNSTVNYPTLYIGATQDAVCRSDLMDSVKDLLPDLETHIVQTAHWDTYEKPEEVRSIVAAWLKKRF